MGGKSQGLLVFSRGLDRLPQLVGRHALRALRRHALNAKAERSDGLLCQARRAQHSRLLQVYQADVTRLIRQR